MLFEKDKYYKYVGTLEKMVNFSYIVLIGLFMIVGILVGKEIGFIIGTLIGFILATTYTLNTKIKIQDMKWKLDIYQKISKI